MNESSVLNPNSNGAPRVIPRYGVYAETDQFHYVQTLFRRGDNFFRGIFSGLEIEVRRTYRHYARRGTTAIAGWAGSEFSGSVSTMEIIPENAIFDNRRELRRHTFIVKWTRT